MKLELEGYERNAVVAELAIAAQEHVLLVGPPGTAKSLFARYVFSQFNARQFFTQLSKFSDESVLFGPLDIAALKKGEYKYVFAGTILDAELAFIDEIFDASDVLLRSLLGVLNERQFQKGSFAVRCPLHTCIATANYTRVNEITEAVTDRFLFQITAPTLTKQQRISLYNGKGYEDWRPAEKKPLPSPSAISHIIIPEAIIDALIALATDLHLSPRRERKIAKALKTKAALEGRQIVTADDLDIIPAMIPLDKQSPNLEDRIRETISILTTERQQREKIEAITWSNERTLEAAKSVLNAIKALQSISACSDAIKSLKEEKLSQAQECHRAILSDLGVL